MFERNGFILFTDLTPNSKCLWASTSIEDCLGYQPEEIIGMSGFDFYFPEDVPTIKGYLGEILANDLVASQSILRYRRKDGSAVMALGIGSICHEFVVCYIVSVEADGMSCPPFRSHSAAMARIVEPKYEEFERIRRHHDAFRSNNTWDPNGLQPEPRVCMILNRFSRTLGVLYASPSCELILHIDVEEIVSKPILLFIRADDLASFVEQVDIAKATNAITHMRFWFQSPNYSQEIPCEAILVSTPDGMLLVMRRCRPFVRRRLIGSMALYDSLYSSAPTSVASSLASQDSGFGRMSTASPSPLPSPPSSALWISHPLGGLAIDSAMANRTPSTRVPVGSIRQIMELDKDEDLKPMVDIHPEESEEMTDLSVREFTHLFREHYVVDDEDDKIIYDESEGDIFM
ncbi:hypothetical protein BGX28_005886 [Mortierella sp. GBA30]|nr:hypothetical protein BGX28_005886 [Mortierella sp. GBA30]